MNVDFMQFNKKCHRIIQGQSEEIGNLYLGNLDSTQQDNLKGLKVKAVLTAAQGADIYITKDLVHMLIEGQDCDDYKMERHFHKAIKFIKDNLAVTNVLVHCFAGVSRSVTLVAAYLMQKHSWTAEKAIKHIQSIRMIAQPNDGFVKQLIKFEKHAVKN